ncbi:alpha/beta fold hydrolase [Xinfangfangia sp. CPCC 101601]|uniref:Alpha/beta fold hydrolase n=1 Tax=Pseudogemmobacter lacusdianii TaxID=3069608 RepID=A0ABU0VW73_9RHOB|nr:alpha/beta fold hydrolase [Xinfangfangia sp. CPCC 101601]MDQ2065190.1 alpha/beta fold hydrolase [Xinfangfangia sp. CPCC 101601]
MIRILQFTLVSLVLISCSPRGEFLEMDEIPPEKAALASEVAVREVVFVGTTRREEDGVYGFGRDERASFLRYDISVPKERKTGEVTWPKNAKRADPTTDFLTLADQRFADGAEFRRELRSAMQLRKQRDVVVYVHGFNNTMAESVYRVAQMHYDLKVPGVAVHYAWPSRGSALGYVYDRDSALFARDGLEQLLHEVAEAGAQRVVLIGHSMGSSVLMETLRQAAIRGDKRLMRSIGGVILISPDLDVDLFRLQAHAIGTLPEPFLIFGSRRDTILGLSSRISGAPERLGNLTDISVVGDLKVTYLDTAAYNQGAGHFNVGTSPALIQLLGGIQNIDAAFRAEAAGRVGLLPGAVLTVQSATSIILAPVTVLAEGKRRPRHVVEEEQAQ